MAKNYFFHLYMDCIDSDWEKRALFKYRWPVFLYRVSNMFTLSHRFLLCSLNKCSFYFISKTLIFTYNIHFVFPDNNSLWYLLREIKGENWETIKLAINSTSLTRLRNEIIFKMIIKHNMHGNTYQDAYFQNTNVKIV